MYAMMSHFISLWQVDDPEDPQFGGMREGEHLPDIIQTDNTSESIWVWTRYYELTGDNQYYQNILDAFTYSLNYPAYLEEGGGSENYGYYRMYNCGWAVRAERKYREVYGDMTYASYGDSCGNYIRDHTLNRFGNPFNDYVNPPVLSWALGNLYWVGMRAANWEWISHAINESEGKVKAWVEEEPELLANETWAMSGGATMWGLLESYFDWNPDEAAAWLATYKDEMDTYSSPGDFQNAWNGWYALGHRVTGTTLHDPYHLGLHMSLTDFLISEDGDGDGGIPARPQDTDEQDQTWVTNYLSFMCVSDILSPLSQVEPVDGGSRSLISNVQSAPNPFGASTQILLDLAVSAELTVAIYDVAGRRIRLLTTGERSAGPVNLWWDGRTDGGHLAPAGNYVASVRTPKATSSQRVVLIR
jgi:hypothetical protein